MGAQMDLLVLDAPRHAFEEDVVAPSCLAAYADPKHASGQNLDEVDGRELATLTAVKELGLAVFRQGLLQRLDVEACAEFDRYPPSQDTCAAQRPLLRGR